MADEPLDTYAIVEAMGHRTAIGRITEATIAGKPLLKVDRLDGAVQYYPPESLYCLTPCTEDQARAAQKRAYGNGLPYALAELTSGAAGTGAWDASVDLDDEDDAIAREEAGEDWNAPDRNRDDDEDDPYTEAGRDYQRAEMAREDRRNEDHDDTDEDEEGPF